MGREPPGALKVRAFGLGAVFALFWGAACATAGSVAEDSQPSGDAATRTVSVRNQNYADVHVYVVQPGGNRRTIGIAPSNSETDYTVSKDALLDGRFHVMLDPVGGGDVKWIRDVVFPGDAVRLIVVASADLTLSHIIVE